ncbi:MAG TPA: hypothetical protein ENG03_03810 [Thioploca sp.]|nr:hypothetical protein [Thioploca sp.]
MSLFGKIKTLIGNEETAETVPAGESIDEFSPEALDNPPYTFVNALHVVRQGNLTKIQDYLNFNSKYARCKNWDDCTLLHEATNFARPDVVELLLAKGADMNALYKDKTPLLFAIEGATHQATNAAQYLDYRKRRLETVKRLLRHKADLDACNAAGELPLHLAAKLGHSELVAVLLARGAPVDSEIESMGPNAAKGGRTPLLLAVKFKKEKKTIKLLLEKGANPNLKDKNPGYAPLHYIAAYHVARQNDSLTEDYLKELTTLLIEHHADVNAPTVDKQMPLHLAINHHHVGVVDVLLENGADIHAKNADGFMAMALSARNGDAAMVDYFLSKGADVYKSRALFHAASCEHSDAALKFLIEKGIDLNKPDPDGYTALFAAIAAYSPTNLKLLLDSGADPRIQPPKVSLKEHAFACWGKVVNLSAEQSSEEEQQKAENAKNILELLGAFKNEKKKQSF